MKPQVETHIKQCKHLKGFGNIMLRTNANGTNGTNKWDVKYNWKSKSNEEKETNI